MTTTTHAAPTDLTAPVGPGAPAPSAAAPSSPWPALVSAAFAAAAFGWLAGSAFDGQLGRVLGVAGSLFGVAVVAASTRSRRPAVVQYAGALAALAVGALLVAPSSGAGSSVGRLVVDAVRNGGLGQPPVLFSPGWRLVVFAVSALLGQTAAGLALALRSPRAAAATAAPLVLGAALLQPPGSEVRGTLVGLLLLVGSLAVPGEEGDPPGVLLRRAARAAAALTVLGAALALAAQVPGLFPTASAERVVPSMRPQLPPSTPDRVLFTVTADRPLTWRLGTLDVYRSPAWLTPPFDPSRLVRLHRDGTVPPKAAGETRGPLTAGPTVTATIRIGDVSGRVLPALADPVRVTGGPAVTYDPRTQELRTAGTAPAPGVTYTVTAAAPPAGNALAAAGPPDEAARPYLDAPTAPAAVQALLAAAPANPFARLQYVRRAYYAHVIAAGPGRPVDVPPARVAQLLAGVPGSPYEITAGEVLLARWAGVPARIGYGYYGGDPVPGTPGTVQVHPRHGATWLEAYFHGSGWVPIVGTPPRARLALDTHQQNGDPSVRASSDLALVVYVPVRLPSVALLYASVRFYAVRVLPVLAALTGLLLLLPAAGRALRRSRRRRAGFRSGPAGRIAAAYAELRDLATDLALGTPALTPLAFLDLVAPDPEHTELAWLVTRGLWGDLRRDLTEADASAAEQMSRSVATRLRRAQPAFNRLSALLSRASLRRPWTAQLPGGWPSRRQGWLAGAILTGLTGALLVGLLGGSSAPATASGPALPAVVAPADAAGVRVVEETAAERAYRTSPLVQDGRVFSLHAGAVIEGSLQVAGLRPGLDTRSARVREQVLAGLGGGLFRPARLGDERIYRLDRPEQVLLLSFSPDGRGYSLMVARGTFADADRVFAALLAFRHGQATPSSAVDIPPPDPRRGGTP